MIQYVLPIIMTAMMAFMPSASSAQEPDEAYFSDNPYETLVDTSNGKLKLSYTDFSIPGRSTSFVFFRYYDSQSNYDGLFGPGWHSTYDYLLRYRPGEKKVVREFIYKDKVLQQSLQPQVSEIEEKAEITEMTGWLNTFVKKGDGFASIHGDLETLTRISGGFLKTAADGTKYYFTQPLEQQTIILPQNSQKTWIDQEGQEHIEITSYSGTGDKETYRLTKIEDRNGNVTRLTYDSQKRLIEVTDPAGRKISFTHNIEGKITSSLGPLSRKYLYEYDSRGNLFRVTNPAGVMSKQFEYDNYHNLTKIIYTNGNELTIDYDLMKDMVTSLTDSSLNRIEYSYQKVAGEGMITTITDSRGNKTVHSYQPGYYEDKPKEFLITDAEGNVWKKYRDARKNIIKEQDPNGGITLYDYDEQGNVIKKTDALGNIWAYEYLPGSNRLSKSIAPNGAAFEFTYDAKGNLTRIKDPSGGITMREYNAQGQMTKETNANNNAITYTYDSYGNLLTETDPLGNKITYTYDAGGNRLSMTDADNKTTLYAYNLMNNLVQTTYPDGAVKENVYNCCELIKAIDENGHAAEYEYDDSGRVTRVKDASGNQTDYTYDENGNRLTKTDGNGNTWSFTYNKLNKMTSLSDPLGNTARYEYDKAGNLIKEIDQIGRVTSSDYDRLNRLLSIQRDGVVLEKYTYDVMGNKLTITDGEGRVTSFEYDLLNRAVSKTTPAGEKITSTYDPLGNVLTVNSSYGPSLTSTYDKNNRLLNIKDSNNRQVEGHTYDATGKRLTQTDAQGKTLTFFYDSRGRRVKTTSPENTNLLYTYDSAGNVIETTNREGKITKYAYDAANKLSSITDPMSNKTSVNRDTIGRVISVTDANGHTTGFEYDQANRRIKEVYADNTFNEFSYDSAGRMITRLDQKSQLTKFEYNSFNQITKKDYPGDNDDTFTYNKIGLMLTASNKDSNNSFSYDTSGSLIQEMQNGKAVNYSHDLANRKRTITYPGGKVFTEAYDASGRIINITGSNQQAVVSYTYDSGNQLINSKAYLNGVVANYSYDNMGRLTSLTQVKGSETIAGYEYGYNKEDNKKYAKALHSPVDSERYSYDDSQRLTGFERGTLSPSGEIADPVAEITYMLDGLGNWSRLIEDGLTEIRLHNEMNECLKIGTVNLSYDSIGNLTDDGTFTYTYDYENHLIEVKKKSDAGILAKYRYDAMGRRISKEVSGTITNYFYDQSRLIEEQTAGQTTAVYTYGAGLDELLSMERGTQTYYYLHNDLGSIVGLTDSNGAVVERYRYNPYGRVEIFDGSGSLIKESGVGNPHFFTGKYLDTETGLYYYRARYYNPSMGRFISRDPAGYTDGMNLYQYTLSNPINFIDPMGLDTCQKYNFSVSSQKWIGWLPEKMKKYTPQGQVALEYSRCRKCCQGGPHDGEYVYDWSLALTANVVWTLKEIPIPGWGFKVPIVDWWLGLVVSVQVSIGGELSGGSDKCNDSYQGGGCVTGGGELSAKFGGSIKVVEAFIGGKVGVQIKICLTASSDGACVNGQLCASGGLFATIKVDIWIASWEGTWTPFEVNGCWDVFKKCI